MKPAFSGLRRRVRARAAPVSLIGAMLIGSTLPSAAEPTFAPLIGSWGGSGAYKLQDGKTEKLKCDAYYTETAGQLGIAVRCAGQAGKIEMRSKLNANGSALTGSWEERTYNAEGTVTGTLTDSTLSLAIAGVVTGTMNITFDKTSQTVAIETTGSLLKSVTVSLSRKAE